MVTNWPVNRGGSASNVLQPWNAKLASSLAMLRRGRYDTINETNSNMLSKKKCRRRSREFISKFGSCLLSLSLKYTHMDSTLWITERGQYGADVIRKRQLSSLVGVSIVHGHGHIGVSNGHKESVSVTDANARVSWSGNDILHDWQTTYPTLSSHQPHGVVEISRFQFVHIRRWEQMKNRKQGKVFILLGQ